MKSRFWLSLLLFIVPVLDSFHFAFARCNDTIPESVRLPKIRSGLDYTEYETEMDEPYRNNRPLFQELFKQHVHKFNNISGSVIQFPSGSKAVYRSAMLAFSPDTLKELVRERGVQTIIHLSNTDIVDQKAWTQTEKETFIGVLGGKEENYSHILDFGYKFKTEEDRQAGLRKVAQIIHQIESAPAGVVIHCLGGEHKTELIFEVMQKCYNHATNDEITKRYQCHTAWTEEPGKQSGYKQKNVDFILSYPCELLKRN